MPDDLSVVCLHESPVAEYFDPPLTTVALPLEELGRAAVELVLERLAGGAPRDVMLAEPPPTPRARLDAALRRRHAPLATPARDSPEPT